MKDLLKEAFINHMNAEFESYYLYLSMAGHYELTSWPGFAKWMHLQAEEERFHAMKFYSFLSERGIQPQLLAIAEPKNTWGNPMELFTEALSHEKKITQLIHVLMDKATEVKDYPAISFLNWFIDEQVEEEATVGEIVDRLERVDSDPKGLMLMDTELGTRSAETA